MEEESRFGKFQSLAGVVVSIAALCFVFTTMSSALDVQRSVMLNTYDDVGSYSAQATQATKDENYKPRGCQEPISFIDLLLGSGAGVETSDETETADDVSRETGNADLLDDTANRTHDAVTVTGTLYGDTVNGTGPVAEAEQTVIDATLGRANDYIESNDLNAGGLASKFDVVFGVFLVLALLGGVAMSSGSGSFGGHRQSRPAGSRPSGHSRR